jgi:hypothetical protein
MIHQLLLAILAGWIQRHCCPAGVRRHIAGDLLAFDAVEDGLNQPGCGGRTG